MNIQLGKTNSKVLVEKYLLEKCKERRKQMGRSEKHYQRHPLHKLAKERLVGVHGVDKSWFLDGLMAITAVDAIRETMNDGQLETKMSLNQLKGIAKFKEAVRIIRIFINVCNRLISIAAEHGKYTLLTGHAHVELHSAAVGSLTGKEDNDLLFDPALYKSKSEATIPQWIFRVCSEKPEDRSEWELRRLCYLLKQIEAFQKYAKGLLNLMAKSATCARFERGRVILRKGHLGRSAYMIFKGSVVMIEKDTEDTNLIIEEDDEEISKLGTVLKNADCFGREALFKSTERQATAVCLSTTLLLIINLDDVNGLGLQKYLNQECKERQTFLRAMPAFESLSDSVIRKLAEKSRTYEYLADKVIEDDTKSQETVYICKRGQFNVLRRIDKGKMKVHEKKRSKSKADDLEDILVPCRIQPLEGKSITRNQWKDNGLSTQASAEKFRHKLHSLKNTRMEKNLGTFDDRVNSEKRHRVLSSVEESEDTLLLKVTHLSRGDIYGVRPKNDESGGDTRDFVLVSGGCELIAIKKFALIQTLNREKFESLLTFEKTFASDEDLYNAFLEQKQWDLYRERLVHGIIKWKGAKGRNRSETL